MTLHEKLEEAEIDLVATLLEHPAGFDLDLFGGLLVIRSAGSPMTSPKTIQVEWETNEGDTSQHTYVRSFPREALREAATFFIKKRHKLQLGLDYESHNPPEDKQLPPPDAPSADTTITLHVLPNEDPFVTCLVCLKDKCEEAVIYRSQTRGGNRARILAGLHSHCRIMPVLPASLPTFSPHQEP